VMFEVSYNCPLDLCTKVNHPLFIYDSSCLNSSHLCVFTNLTAFVELITLDAQYPLTRCGLSTASLASDSFWQPLGGGL
ncbi:hypothetical protein EWB00_002128, partial [Schistosoma japonicum]